MFLGGVRHDVKWHFLHCLFRICIEKSIMAYVRDLSLRAKMPEIAKRKVTISKFGDMAIPEGYSSLCTMDCVIGVKLLYRGDKQRVMAYCCQHNYSEFAETLLRNRFIAAHRSGTLYPKDTRKYFHATDYNEVWYKVDDLLPCNGCALNFLNRIDLNDHVEIYHLRGLM